jgi:hypothetical protein
VAALAAEIDRVISDDTAFARNAAHMRTQKSFAVRPGISGLLDVARVTFSETTEGVCRSPSATQTHTLRGPRQISTSWRACTASGTGCLRSRPSSARAAAGS